MSIKSINPATGQTIQSFKEHSTAEVNKMIQKAASCYNSWGKFAISVRSKVIMRVGELLEKRKHELAELATLEMGKPISQSITEIEKCAFVCKFYGEGAKQYLKDNVIHTESEASVVSYQPLGVILGVMPWNFPFWQVFRFAAPTLMAGNVCLLKHASNVPQCALAIKELFNDANAPDGLFQTLLISSSKVKKLIEMDEIAAVTLTGSESAGSNVAETAGKQIKKSVLELGGSDPFIVLREANLNLAAETAVRSRMINSGQSCVAAKRFIIEKDIYESFIKILKQKYSELVVGDPMDPETDVGPLAREDIVKGLADQVKQSIKKGATIEVGGARVRKPGYYFKPTLISGARPGIPVFDQEVFGPVASLTIVESEEEAVKMANHSRFGLGASVWTENKEQGIRVAKLIEAGNVFINGMVRSDPRLPFGGIKKSGYGRELSENGIKEFVNIKTIVLE